MARVVDEYFDSIAGEYDSIARRAMPRYDEMLSQLVRYLPDSPHDVLELGCGTGALTVRLARRYPGARLSAIDGSKEMVEIARARLAADRIETAAFSVALFEELDLPADGHDLIASNMSLHHVADKAPFYAKLQRALRPGGLLVVGDELQGATPEVERLHWDAWLAFAHQPGHLTEPEVARIGEHAERFDHYETLPAQLELLQHAGFAPVDCVWRYLNYAIFVAQS